VTAATTYDFTLVVTDGSGAASLSSSVTITVDPALRPPVADAGIAITAASGAQVELDGSDSTDPDGGALTYQWTQVAGPSVTLNDPSAAQPHFTAPLVTVSIPLTFQLVVTNPASATSAPDTVSVFVEAAPDNDDGGCCSAGGSPGAGQLLLAGLPLLALLTRRRRRA
jgi:uncharacterized protein (TIGR03382 family)